MIAVCAEHTPAHAGAARKVRNRDALEPQCPRRKKMETAVPREIVNARRGLEECHRPAHWLRRVPRDLPCRGSNAMIVESPDNPAHYRLPDHVLNGHLISRGANGQARSAHQLSFFS
jgi:hypothetical protein